MFAPSLSRALAPPEPEKSPAHFEVMTGWPVQDARIRANRPTLTITGIDATAGVLTLAEPLR